MTESLNIVKQGASFKDKFTLFTYFLRIPSILLKSLATGKDLRALEDKQKFLKRDVTLKNRYGVFFCGRNIFTVYTASEGYEKHLFPFIEMASGVFIDVGAHVGRYTVALGNRRDVIVLAIEPEQYNFSMLKKNIELNHLVNITAINEGAYSSSGTIPFFRADLGEGMHSVFEQTKDATQISVDTLDNMVEKTNLVGQVKKIKIDAEGAEVEILKGAKKILEKDHPTMMVEIWQKNAANLSCILDLLAPYHYSVQQLDHDNYLFF